MKHGRPFRYYELHGYHDKPCSEGGTYSILLEKAVEFRGGNAQAANALVRGWRREHAARVFQAIQANVMAMSAFVCGIAAGNLTAGDMDLDIEAAEQSMRNCGWGSLLED